MAEAYPQRFVKCLCCQYESDSEADLLNHVTVHCYEKNYRIPCFFCCQSVKTIQLYNRHSKICPKKERIEAESEIIVQSDFFWHCKNCPEKINISGTDSNDDFLKVRDHLFGHSIKKEVVFCPNPKCEISYDLYRSFTRHMRNKHEIPEDFRLRCDGKKYSEIRPEDIFEPITDNSESETEDEQAFLPQSELSSNNEVVQELVDQTELLEQDPSTTDNLFKMNSIIKRNEALFALRLTAKASLSQEIVSEIFSFCEDIHKLKLEFITTKLKQDFAGETNTKIEDAIETAKIMDHLAGLGKAGLSTHYRRDKMLQTYFDFIVPKVTRIELSFYI